MKGRNAVCVSWGDASPRGQGSDILPHLEYAKSPGLKNIPFYGDNKAVRRSHRPDQGGLLTVNPVDRATCPNETLRQKIMSFIKMTFKIGAESRIKTTLGLEITRDRIKRTITI